MRNFLALTVGFIWLDPCGALAPVPEPRLEWRWTELGEPLDRHITSVAFSADGKLIAAGGGDRICVWSVETGKAVSRMSYPAPQRQYRLAFGPDGKVLASEGNNDPMLRFFDVKTGKQVREAERSDWVVLPGKKYDSAAIAFSPDSTTVIEKIAAAGGGLRLMDTATGKDRIVGKNAPTFHDPFVEAAFAPDSKTFAYNGPKNQLRVFETATGKLVRELRPEFPSTRFERYESFVRFSPDGQYLLACEFLGRSDNRDRIQFVIWGVNDGKRYWQTTDSSLISSSTVYPSGLIGPGNRYLVTNTKTVYDLLTDERVPIKDPFDKEANQRFPTRYPVGASPDGSVLAFVGDPSNNDEAARTGKLAIYLTPAPILPPPVPTGDGITDETAEKMWSGIVAENLFRRESCTAVLAAKPDLAIRLAKAKLKPVPPAELERVAKLLKDFDDNDSDVRDKAQDDLQAVAYQFEIALTAALKSAPAGELKNRLVSILRTKNETPPPAGLLADLRAIEFLRRIDSAEAKEVLKSVAGGAAGARLTAEAAAVLAR
jgi:WD40 repeat protein